MDIEIPFFLEYENRCCSQNSIETDDSSLKVWWDAKQKFIIEHVKEIYKEAIDKGDHPLRLLRLIDAFACIKTFTTSNSPMKLAI